ncbi:MAG: NAD(P)/FAD-dependent oxidoreductase [Pseudomonadota bacterium]
MIYDVLIIGAGPAGTRAALDTAAAGLSVALVCKGLMGGTCLNVGCIPTKMLLGATAVKPMIDVQTKLKNLQADVSFNFANIQMRKDRFIAGTRKALEKRLFQAKVTIFNGSASFSGPNAAIVTPENGDEPQTIQFAKAVIATGSMPAAFPNLTADGVAVLDSTQLLAVQEAPASLIIVGGGAIGLEMGDFFSRLGTSITIVEGMDRLAPTEDAEVGETLRKGFAKEGWKVVTGKRVASLLTVDGQAVLTFEDGETLVAEKALMAAGRRPASQELNLAAIGATVRGAGWIETDAKLMASPNVYAIGDCNGRTLLAHAAEHQAKYVARQITQCDGSAYMPPAMPSCIYGHTEVMRVGPTVLDLQKQGNTVMTSRSQLIANPIAQSYGTTGGWVKVLWVNNKVFGVVAVGHGVSHLVTIAELLVVMKWDRTAPQDFIFAHPTLDESIDAALHAPLENVTD